MKTSLIIRFTFIVALWLLLCYLVVSSQPLTFRVIFIIVASGIVVLVPLWKKYIRNKQKENGNDSQPKR